MDQFRHIVRKEPILYRSKVVESDNALVRLHSQLITSVRITIVKQQVVKRMNDYERQATIPESKQPRANASSV